MQRINSTEEVLKENRRKLEMLHQERTRDQESITMRDMDSLLLLGRNDQSKRIRQKVKYKQATFAELKAEASKILEDLNF